MKTYLLAVCLLIIICAIHCARDPERQKSRRMVALRCIRETRVRYSTVKKFQRGDFTQTSKKAKCFLKCFAAKIGMFEKEDDTYEINEAFIFKYLDDIIKDESLIPIIVNKCKAVDRGENVCDYAFNAYHCFYNETHDKPEIIDNSETTFDSFNEADVAAEHNAFNATQEESKIPKDDKTTQLVIETTEAAPKSSE